MALVVELLGAPRVGREDGPLPSPRGRKTWCLLAYLLLTTRPPARERLAELLFAEAEDPLGALRWSLSDLRRVLGPGATVGGDPVVVSLPPTAVVDVDLVLRGRWEEAVGLDGLGRELLEGIGTAGSAAFEIWLAHQRRRLTGATEAILHEAALTGLATGGVGEALGHAARLVELNPLEEAHHVLLVECLKAAGDHRGAARHVERCTAMFVRELGAEPGPALREAAAATVGTPRSPRPGLHRLSVAAMLDAGESAITAGAAGQGLETLRQAVAVARRDQDGHLPRALLALGHALVHLGRGGDEEGAAALHEAAIRAARAGATSVAAAAHRELAFSDLQRGRYQRARDQVRAASALASGDDAEMAWVESIDGACLSDLGRHAESFTVLRSALARAERAGDGEAQVFALNFLGRLHLLRGELAEAAGVLGLALAQARVCWTALSPFPESLLAEVRLREGDVDRAETCFERAFVMGRQLDDPCLESIATRGLGLVAVARDDVTHGYRLLIDAPRISRRLPDSYLWIEGYGLDALCAVAVEHRMPAAPRWAADLGALASRCGMRELLVRSMVHRARLGEDAALDAARELAAPIDNPALHAELRAGGG